MLKSMHLSVTFIITFVSLTKPQASKHVINWVEVGMSFCPLYVFFPFLLHIEFYVHVYLSFKFQLMVIMALKDYYVKSRVQSKLKAIIRGVLHV